MEKVMYQCQLKSGNATMITWLSNEKKFKLGDFITLKDSKEPEVLWKVTAIGQPHKVSDVKMKWNSQDLKRDGNRKKVM